MIKSGDIVRVVDTQGHVCPKGRTNNKTAKVIGPMGAAYPGGFMMDRDLLGCKYWNEESLEVVR